MPIASTAEEYVKQLGRDGAYSEIDVSHLLELVNAPEPRFAVLLNNRLDISDSGQIEALRAAVAQIKGTPETQGMSDEQLGFYVFRTIFEKGLEHWKEKKI